ncbi:2-hydroxyacid dehydrogenase [Paralcaligenes sp. KSB-10]|uniref:2-hydroxyacid dehydrogenase n=1 Tax=Paralcaligenes sp. KSB-10 TaxID=2901142 RepID=UPI001E4A0CD1|nr:2-hydroxyacid dehydrogenase [Paralcaligenes sp. KSB-10]UHL63182.1 2-hydroxyacid dehydrogenase [Paralcaligenes sp. KSB-10]
MNKKIKILQAAELPGKAEQALREQFTVLALPKEAGDIDALLLEHGAEIRGIAVRKRKIDAAMIQRLPALEVISSYSAGLEGVDVAAAQARGIAVHNTSEALAEDVADLGLCLIISIARGVHNGHDFVRDGRWPSEAFPLGRSVRSLKAGIIGLGHIGSALARRLDSMKAEIAYFGPRPKPVPYLYFPDLLQMAHWADMLVVTCPGGAATRHLVDRAVIGQLGPNGFLVNISRGSVVDERALIEALENRALAGAGLDVFENEPDVPTELRNSDRVVLSPHMGSGSQETRELMGDSMVGALVAHFQAR